jgi:hydrogenase maturation factor
MTRSGAFAPQCHPEVGCITCGDEGIAMRVLKLDAPHALAVCVDAAGSTSEVDLGLVAGVGPGDEVLVHAGVAIAPLEPELRRVRAPNGERSALLEPEAAR